MDEIEEPMGMFGEHVVWWPKNQVTFTFHSPIPFTPDNKQSTIDSLHLDDINSFLGDRLQLTLKSFEVKDVPRPREPQKDGESHLVEGNGQQDGNDSALNIPIGKYLFPSPDTDKPESMILTFFHIEPTTGADAARRTTVTKGSKGDKTDRTVDVVNLFNTTLAIKGSTGEDIQVPTAMPNWFGGGTQDVIHGCPATPPMPLQAHSSCTATGYCPISYQGLSEELQGRDGFNVRVFVLDTIPAPEKITSASQLANPPGGIARNRLLQGIATGMESFPPFNAAPPAINVNYQTLSVDLEDAHAPGTGRDLHGHLVGYPLLDHGLFVAGIIRDLASHAQIECVRVLNDFGVGKLSILTQALEKIQDRMLNGDLQNVPVVINLSLVMTPYDQLFHKLGFVLEKPDEKHTHIDLREGLHNVIKTLVKSGAVFVAAAGNDSNSLEMAGRMGPRYPARFPEVVSVASVTRDGKTAARYSNRAIAHNQQPHGIATYGGHVSQPVKPQKLGLPVAPTPTNCMTGAEDIDALIGVFSSQTYPELAEGDCHESYPAPNPDAWAYWSGTSFSTPIISALVARMLQGPSLSGTSSQQVIATINSNAVITNPPLPVSNVLKAIVLRAVQCYKKRRTGHSAQA